jgi:DNA repair exonuclease SbcCD ATPase subunit
MVKRKSWLCCALLGITVIVAACGTAQKDAIDAAINAAQSAINAVQAEAAKYAPDQLQAAQSTLQNAKDELAKGDYPAALSAARDAANKARELASTATSKKDEWTKTWNETSSTVPKTLNQIKAKLDAYAHGARLPEGMDKSQLDDAKAKYEQLKQSWTDAASQATRGNLRDAMNKIPGIQETLAKLKETLGIK